MQQPEFTSGPTLIVVGSMSSVSHRQARVLEDTIPVTSIRIHADLEGRSRSELNPIAGRILEVRPQLGKRYSRRSRTESDSGPWRAPMPHRRYSCSSHPYASLVGSLFATGGETARAILEGWDIRSLHMLGELEPGLSFWFGRIQGRDLILTKAGGFGNQDTLVSCWRFLTNLARTSNFDRTRNLL